MPQSPELRLDASAVMKIGQRDHQEDALVTDFPHLGDLSFAVLSDGMGGHAAGEIASKIVVTEVFSELKLQSGDLDHLREKIRDVLTDAALGANACVAAHAESDPQTRGMGATLLAPVVLGDQLHWISIGDSPLYLFRDGKLKQVNEDHSLGPQIDLMATNGLIADDVARIHPDRNCLTSVLVGQAIDRIDCPETPIKLLPGDVVIAASDGLQTLDDEEIQAVLAEHHHRPAHELAELIVDSVETCDDPQQDNISICVIRVEPYQPALQSAAATTGLRVVSAGRTTDNMFLGE